MFRHSTLRSASLLCLVLLAAVTFGACANSLTGVSDNSTQQDNHTIRAGKRIP